MGELTSVRMTHKSLKGFKQERRTNKERNGVKVKDYGTKWAEAMDRKRLSDKLSPQERIKGLDATFGTGQGAKRERAKLARLASIQPPVKGKKQGK